ncbi:MAG: calcium/sodium antiporter [Candidatus Dojkabacteria bacterium]
MEIILYLIIILAAFAAMGKVVDLRFISSLDNIAEKLKLSPSISGATLMAFGTSAPEISTATFAVFLAGSSPATGLGTVVGSALFQILVVIGFAAYIRKTKLKWQEVMREGVFYMFTIILLLLVLRDNVVEFEEALAMVSTYFVYLFFLLGWNKYVPEINKKDKDFDYSEAIEEESKKQSKYRNHTLWDPFLDIFDAPFNFLVKLIPNPEKKKQWTVPVFLFSLAIIAALSYVLVASAEALALELGIPAAIIALTILAGGTSIPELISSAVVARQGRGAMAISNALGSNVFDILMSLGLPLLLFTGLNGDLTDVGANDLRGSLWLLLGTMFFVIGYLYLNKFRLDKRFGVTLLVVYILYVVAAYLGMI